jgi:hypothetical protein
MPYTPKRLINSNLYTAGNEYFIQKTGQPYTGPYHQDFNGTAYTGANPNVANRQALIKNPNTAIPAPKIIRSATTIAYDTISSTNKNILKFGKDPKSFTPSPTTSDYNNGTITRYFAKKRNNNNNSVIETSSEAYGSINSKDGDYNYTIWKVALLKWKISGNENDVSNFNLSSKLRANQTLKGIGNYLSNDKQFFKPSVESQPPSRILRRIPENRPRSTTRSRRASRGGSSIPRGNLY